MNTTGIFSSSLYSFYSFTCCAVSNRQHRRGLDTHGGLSRKLVRPVFPCNIRVFQECLDPGQSNSRHLPAKNIPVWKVVVICSKRSEAQTKNAELKWDWDSSIHFCDSRFRVGRELSTLIEMEKHRSLGSAVLAKKDNAVKFLCLRREKENVWKSILFLCSGCASDDVSQKEGESPQRAFLTLVWFCTPALVTFL